MLNLCLQLENTKNTERLKLWKLGARQFWKFQGKREEETLDEVLKKSTTSKVRDKL